jgi:hypothetical protein
VCQIHYLVGQTISDFEAFYEPAIFEFVTLVQSIPENEQGLFSQTGSFIDRGLERAANALSLLKKCFFSNRKFSELEGDEALWIYAVFTVALMRDIGKLGVKYEVTVYPENRLIEKIWNPFASNMAEQGKYYEFTYVKENKDELSKCFAPLLARQVLDQGAINYKKNVSGFSWIASNLYILEVWLAMFSGDERKIPMTSFMTVIPSADLQTIQSNLKLMKISNVNNLNLFQVAADPIADYLLSADYQLGEAFCQWLREKIIHSTQEKSAILLAEGLLLDTALFKDFALEKNPGNSDPQIIEKTFRRTLEIYNIPLNEVGRRYTATGGIAVHARQKWLMIHTPNLLLAFGYMPGMASTLGLPTAPQNSTLAAFPSVPPPSTPGPFK